MARLLFPPAKKPDGSGLRRIGDVDARALAERVAAIPDAVWDAETAARENDFDCFSQTRHILLRFIGGNRDARDFYETALWAEWADLVLPVMTAAVADYGFAHPVFPKAMFARLSAHGRITRHTDGVGSNIFTHKIHVPLITNDDAWLVIGRNRHHLEPGCAYEINNLAPHGAINRGDADRTHFIFEVYDAAVIGS